MEEITITNRIYEGKKYDIQTVQLAAFEGGASVHFQIMKCKVTGKITAPTVDVFAHSSNDNMLPQKFELKIFADNKMTKNTVHNETYSVINMIPKEVLE